MAGRLANIEGHAEKFLFYVEVQANNHCTGNDVEVQLPMDKSNASNARTKLLKEGKIFLTGETRPTVNSKQAQVVVHDRFATAVHRAITAEYLKDLKATKPERHACISRIESLLMSVLDKDRDGASRRKRIVRAIKLTQWLDTQYQ